MFFVVSKLLDELLAPLTWALVLVAAAALGRRRRWAPWAAAAAVVILCAFSMDAVSNRLVRGLETPPLTSDRPDRSYDVAIVLGGLISEGPTRQFGVAALNDNVERLTTAFELLHSGRVRNVILSGGSGHLLAEQPEAPVLARVLADWGIEPGRIFEEKKSRNTHENAVESAAIVRAHGWASVLLITSAYHMPRALGCFRKEGLAVETLAVDFRSSRRSTNWWPNAGALVQSTGVIHEWAGRWIYRVRGFSVAP